MYAQPQLYIVPYTVPGSDSIKYEPVVGLDSEDARTRAFHQIFDRDKIIISVPVEELRGIEGLTDTFGVEYKLSPKKQSVIRRLKTWFGG